MKKSIFVLLLLITIVPSVAFASWWNPFSWFGFWGMSDSPVNEVRVLPHEDTRPDIVPTDSNTQIKQENNSNAKIVPPALLQVPKEESLKITTTNLPRAKVGKYYSAKIETSGIDPKNGYNWSVSNTFPMIGFSFGPSSSNSIYITGTPSKIYVDGIEQKKPHTFSFVVTVNSGSQTVSKQFSLTVDPEVVISTTTSLVPTISSINTATGMAPRIGDMVDVFGTNFTSKAGISIDGVAEQYNTIAQYVSPTLINFFIPSNLSLGSHRIEVYVPISTGGAYVSNEYYINIVSN